MRDLSTHPSTANAVTERVKFGPFRKKTWAMIPSSRPFHSARISIDLHDCIIPPTIQAEQDQEDTADCQRSHNLRTAPRIAAAAPVERHQHQCGANDEQQRADGINGPRDLAPRHLLAIGIRFWPVEHEKPQSCGHMQAELDPEDVSPATDTDVGDGAGSELGRSGRY